MIIKTQPFLTLKIVKDTNYINLNITKYAKRAASIKEKKKFQKIKLMKQQIEKYHSKKINYYIILLMIVILLILSYN